LLVLELDDDVVDKFAVSEEVELVVLTGGVATVESGERGSVRSTTTFDCSED